MREVIALFLPTLLATTPQAVDMYDPERAHALIVVTGKPGSAQEVAAETVVLWIKDKKCLSSSKVMSKDNAIFINFKGKITIIINDATPKEAKTLICDELQQMDYRIDINIAY